MDDLVSRRAAIDAPFKKYDMSTGATWIPLEYIEQLPSAQPEIIRCKDCKHRPVKTASYDDDAWDCGFSIKFPDYRCPCQCDDGYYNRFPDDDWFCGNAERRTDDKR